MWSIVETGEGNGTPLQYSCLENPMDGGAWWAAVHGVAKSRTRLSDFTFTFHFHALEKEMATYSSVLALRTPGTGGLPSLGSHRVGHDWSDLAAAAPLGDFCHLPSHCPSPAAVACSPLKLRKCFLRTHRPSARAKPFFPFLRLSIMRVCWGLWVCSVFCFSS